MGLFETLVLALVQGFTEFLPVSSSGHLVLVPVLFGWDDPGLGFSAALHFGTLLAILVYFWKEWMRMISAVLDWKNIEKSGDRQMAWMITLATLPGGVAGFFLADIIESSYRDPVLVGVFIAVGAGILWWSERWMRGNVTLDALGERGALWIGLSQALALIPGISRSGITMAVGMMYGLSRRDSARFSFLMSAPITLGASIFSMPELIVSGFSTELFLATAVAFVSALVVIGIFLRWIERVKYRVFVWYGIVLALATILFL